MMIITKELSSLSYIFVDNVITCDLRVGQGAMLAKMDEKQAYHNVPVHSNGMGWPCFLLTPDCLLEFLLPLQTHFNGSLNRKA